jgi:hypothetical protein
VPPRSRSTLCEGQLVIVSHRKYLPSSLDPARFVRGLTRSRRRRERGGEASLPAAP